MAATPSNSGGQLPPRRASDGRVWQRRRLGRTAPPLRRVRQGADRDRRLDAVAAACEVPEWTHDKRGRGGSPRPWRGGGGGGGCGAGGRGRRHKGGEAGRRGGAAQAKSKLAARCRRGRRVRAAGQAVEANRRGSLRRRRARLGGGGELGRRVQLAERTRGHPRRRCDRPSTYLPIARDRPVPPTARRADERGSALEHQAGRRARRPAHPARRARRAARRPGLRERVVDDPPRRAPPLA
jgi:hypothetical protein